MTNIKRISLLSETEINDLYARQDFNHYERTLYFAINEREHDALSNYSNVRTRVYFILQLGYFKAKHQFFKFNFEDMRDDVEYILVNFFSSSTTVLSGCISRNYIDQQKNDILKLFDYQNWSTIHRDQVQGYICELLRFYPKSHSALRQLIDYLDSKQIIIPTYRTLQDMFSAAFSAEEKRLDQIILSVPLSIQVQLSSLINKTDGISQLNVLRVDQKDFQYTAIRAEVDKAEEIADLYEFAKTFIPTLKLSKNAVRYYADIAEQYAAFRLRQLSKPQQWLHVVCFVYHRYQQIMDNLITSFMYHTRTIMEAGKTYSGIAMMEHSASVVADFPKLAQFLEWFPKRNKDLDHDALNQAAYSILPEEQFSALAKFLHGNTFDKTAAKWEFYLKSSRMFSLYLRPILLAVRFEHYKNNSKVMELINLLKTHYVAGKNPAMFKLSDDLGLTIPKNMTPYLKRELTDEHVDPYLFEFYVYQKIYHQLDRGVLYCNASISYCDIDQDLVDEALVVDVEKISTEFGYSKIPIYCDERLDDAIRMLDDAGILQPKGNININRIKSQKRGILRVLLSLIMQENTQSNIIRKLNSHARYVRLRAALFEYNKIFKSIHTLKLIDSMQFRKAIRTARNRTEAYHQLQGFIRKIYNGIFNGRKIMDNRVSAHAARLIANCIIAYNSTILNTVYQKMIRDGASQEVIDEFARISPIAWVHILFAGRYSFQKSTGNIDVVEMAKIVEIHLRQYFWKAA